ncbi:MAG: coproporphyrinogen III oxidase [Alphaproteobacteria bacterium]|nr:MAG: coproporphyrinogen III oxidase [Alphaproteobacteria bacterium]
MPASKNLNNDHALAIYIHWPYCERICPYCDFNVYRHRAVDMAVWQQSYLRELQYLNELVPGRRVQSIYFGGGTPSLMAPEVVATLIEFIGSQWSLDADAEISLEANPTDAESQRFRAFKSAGVNRLSLGVQALNDEDLKKLGRWHTADEARQAFFQARDAFDNVSIDLIYARPQQSADAWGQELATALAMNPDHLSLYQLTIEPGTAFERNQNRGTIVLPDDNEAVRLYQLSQEICDASGFYGYEVSNHARAGFESRHNLSYWRYGDYAGIGPGAHGRLSVDGVKYATISWRDPARWLEQIARHGRGVEQMTAISRDDQAAELVLMGLRLDEGISLSRYRDVAGLPFDEIRLGELEQDGFITVTQTRVRVTGKGRTVLNAVIGRLMA